MDIKLP